MVFVLEQAPTRRELWFMRSSWAQVLAVQGYNTYDIRSIIESYIARYVFNLTLTIQYAAFQSLGAFASLMEGVVAGELTLLLTGLGRVVSTASIGSLKRTSSHPYAFGVSLMTVCRGILM